MVYLLLPNFRVSYPVRHCKWNKQIGTILPTTNEIIESKKQTQVRQQNKHKVEPITSGEVKEVLKNMKNGKAARPGDFPVELVKYATEIWIELIAKMFNKYILNGDNIPKDQGVAYMEAPLRLVL